MNKNTLAKAIVTVVEFILGMIALGMVIGNYPIIGLIILFGAMAACAIGMLYMFTMAVYDHIEFNKKYGND